MRAAPLPPDRAYHPAGHAEWGFEVVQDALRHLHERIRFHKGFIPGPMGRMLRSTEGEEVFRGGELIKRRGDRAPDELFSNLTASRTWGDAGRVS